MAWFKTRPSGPDPVAHWSQLVELDPTRNDPLRLADAVFETAPIIADVGARCHNLRTDFKGGRAPYLAVDDGIFRIAGDKSNGSDPGDSVEFWTWMDYRGVRVLDARRTLHYSLARGGGGYVQSGTRFHVNTFLAGPWIDPLPSIARSQQAEFDGLKEARVRMASDKALAKAVNEASLRRRVLEDRL